MAVQFKYLFTPFQLKYLTLRNRIVFLPHLSMYATEDHLPSEKHVYYFAERAKGGVGLIVMETQAISPKVEAFHAIFACDRRAIPGWRKIIEGSHAHGVPIIGQMQHYGNFTTGPITWFPGLCASPIPDHLMRETPKEMEIEDIREAVEDFVTSARNIKEAGFDGVEFASFNHCGVHRMFHSPYFNRRTDEYGGSLENRMRFGREAIGAVRSAVGDDYLIGVRLCLDELVEGGYTLDEGLRIAKALEGDEKIDYINADIGTSGGSVHLSTAPSMAAPPGYAMYAVAALRGAVKMPIIAFGRINDVLQAEKILADGQADLVGIARALMTDPELPKKAYEGRLDDIRPCVGCNQGCVGRIYQFKRMVCIHNPAAWREKELGIDTLVPARVKKRVMVVGGGPAGLKAAEVAARRGHDVTLYEREGELGGQVNLAVKAPLREELGGVTRHLVKQVQGLGVKVRLGVEITPQMVLAEKPDVVVVATGSTPLKPDVPGVDHENVVTARDVLRGVAKVGNRVLLFDDDGHWAASGTAEFLADRGKKVEVVTPLLYVGKDLDPASLIPLYQRLHQKGVAMTPNTTLKAVSGNTVTVADVYSGEERRVEGVDTVVLATGSQAEDRLYKALKGKVEELHRVGDCVAPRRLEMAIYEGNQVGRVI